MRQTYDISISKTNDSNKFTVSAYLSKSFTFSMKKYHLFDRSVSLLQASEGYLCLKKAVLLFLLKGILFVRKLVMPSVSFYVSKAVLLGLSKGISVSYQAEAAKRINFSKKSCTSILKKGISFAYLAAKRILSLKKPYKISYQGYSFCYLVAKRISSIT